MSSLPLVLQLGPNLLDAYVTRHSRCIIRVIHRRHLPFFFALILHAILPVLIATDPIDFKLNTVLPQRDGSGDMRKTDTH